MVWGIEILKFSCDSKVRCWPLVSLWSLGLFKLVRMVPVRNLRETSVELRRFGYMPNVVWNMVLCRRSSSSRMLIFASDLVMVRG